PPVRCTTLKTSDKASMPPPCRHSVSRSCLPVTGSYTITSHRIKVIVRLSSKEGRLQTTPEWRPTMTAMDNIPDNSRYARCIESSKRVRWDIDEDVIRGRRFDTGHKFLPDGLSLTDGYTTLSSGERRFVSQIQGRTYANVFGLVERFINAKVLELGRDH